MGLSERAGFYRQLETKRGKPLIVYVTSMRRNATAQIAGDTISELLVQLEKLPPGTVDLDLMLGSYGGDGSVAWRIVSLIRERVQKFSVLVPQAAFSAGTLIALGADELVIHPHGNLGPTDPQITNLAKNVQFGSEDLAAYLKFARDEVGLTDQAPLVQLFKDFSAEVGYVGIGVAARSAQLTQSMGEKLLRLHMKTDAQAQKAKLISETLSTKYFHHGYPVSRTEAKDLELPVAERNEEVEKLMWQIWTDIEKEMEFREPYSPVRILKTDPDTAALFDPALVPAPGAPPLIRMAKMRLLSAIMESTRHASRAVSEGDVTGARHPDLSLKINVLPYKEGWVDDFVLSQNP